MKKYLEIFSKKIRREPSTAGSDWPVVLDMLEVVAKPLVTVDEKRFFHRSLVSTLQKMITLRNVPVYLFHHHRSEGNLWYDAQKDGSISLSATKKYEALIELQPFFTKQESLPQKQEIDAITGNGSVKALMLFQFFHEYDYLLFCTISNAEVNDFFRLVQKLVTELKNKLELHNRITRLTGDIHSSKRALNDYRMKLRETERSLKKRIYEINNLLEISSELYSILEFDQLISSALLTIVGQLGCQRAFALLFDAQKNSFTRYYTKGYEASANEDVEFVVDDPLVSYFIENQRPVKLQELEKLARLKKFAKKLNALQMDIIAPVVHSNRLIGIIGCGSRLYDGQFDQSDYQIFALLVSIISISISNAEMYENVKKMSFTDAMTSLNNYRYFETRLREELNRARRNDTTVSLLMLDIDHFKNYNDTLGHQAGDEALRVMGWILRSAVRDEDVVNRYGGEEFSIILPGLDKKVLPILAERIRQKVEEHPFYKEHIQPGERITVSLGGANFPEDADSFDKLVECADVSLYASKKAGRNRFTLYKKSLTKKD